MNFDLDEAIYERFIAPTEKERNRKIGIEFELPIVNLNGGPVDFDVVHAMTEEFVKKFSFTFIERDEDGAIFDAVHHTYEDGISFDCSYNTLEFSFGAEENLTAIYERFIRYYQSAKSILERHAHTLTGMGINPGFLKNHNEPVHNERYRMLFHHLCSYRDYEGEILFHNQPNFGLFTCANQIQLDVKESDLVKVLNTFTKLEPLKVLLFANSPWGPDHEILCSRDNFWRNSLHGLNRHNVDMYGLEFESIDEVILYIRSMSLYCTERDGKYINFHPTPLMEYFELEQVQGEYFEGGSYHPIAIHPEAEDLAYLRPYNFEALTFRGTVEFRSVCEQPIGEIMASPAFHVGLMHNLDALAKCLEEDHVIYHQGYNASELRRMFGKRKIPEAFDQNDLSLLLLRVLSMAEEGLKERGWGEERFLEPLFSRAQDLLSPAREMVQGLDQGLPIESYIEKYGELPEDAQEMAIQNCAI